MEYKIIEIDTTDFSTSGDQFKLLTDAGWIIHTTYPIAVGLFLMQRDERATVTAIQIIDNGYGTRIPVEIKL